MNAAEAQAALLIMGRMGRPIDPIRQAKAEYVRGQIEVDELERKVEAALKAERWGWKAAA